MNKKDRKLYLVAAGLMFSFFITLNCALSPAQNGPSCIKEVAGVPSQCQDLISTESAAMADFEADCSSSGGTYSTSGCDLAVYDVSGHCEYSLTNYDYAEWYSTQNSWSQWLATIECNLYINGTWVP